MSERKEEGYVSYLQSGRRIISSGSPVEEFLTSMSFAFGVPKDAGTHKSQLEPQPAFWPLMKLAAEICWPAPAIANLDPA
jgi:hypothetical protein